MLVFRVEAEFGLDGGAVDAEAVKTLSCSAGEFHILLPTMRVDGERDLDVHAGNELGVGQLPDVNVVAGDDSRESFNVVSDFLDADVLWGGLKEDASGGQSQGNRGLEDNDGDEEGDSRISVELSRPVGKPDDKGSNHNTNVSESIANDVQNHGIHTHIAVAMTVLLSWLLGKGMVMAIMSARISSSTLSSMRVRVLVAIKSAVTVALRVLEEGRLLAVLFLFQNGRFGIRIAFTR